MLDLKDVIMGPWALSHNKRKQVREAFRKLVLAGCALTDAKNEFYNLIAPVSRENQAKVAEWLTKCAMAHGDFGLDEFDTETDAMLLDLV